MPRVKNELYTQEGHPLTMKESEFINKYLETNNVTQSYIAVYKKGDSNKIDNKKAYINGNEIREKPYIKREILARQQQILTESIMSAEEIYAYLTRVVRGEEKDQFGLEVSISERTRAATELLKRLVDIPNKLQGNEVPEVKITLDWSRPEIPTIDTEYEEVLNGNVTAQVGD